MAFNTKAMQLTSQKIVLLLLLAFVLFFAFTSVVDLMSFSKSSMYETTKKECDFLQGNIYVEKDPKCSPKNCDVLNCSEEKQEKWDLLVGGFEESKCYEDESACESYFEERMYAMVVEGETFESGSSSSGFVPKGLITEVDSNYREKYEGKLSEEFIVKVEEIASNLGTEPEYLLAVMDFETGGTFDPGVENLAQSGAVGLIQFMPETADKLGTTTSDLASMTRMEQLEYVEKYFESFNVEYSSLSDVYMAVLYPKALNKGENYVLFEKGSKAYSQNRGLDVDKNGEIVVAEAVHKVGSHYRVS